MEHKSMGETKQIELNDLQALEQEILVLKKLVLKPEIIVFWDLVSIPLKKNFSAKLIYDVLRHYVNKFSSAAEYHAFYKDHDNNFQRNRELITECKINGHSMSSVKATNIKKKNYDFAISITMYEKLLRTTDYKYVLIITNDSIFEPLIRQLKDNDTSRQFILLHGSTYNKRFSENSMWDDHFGKSHNAEFSSLFKNIIPDRFPVEKIDESKESKESKGQMPPILAVSLLVDQISQSIDSKKSASMLNKNDSQLNPRPKLTVVLKRKPSVTIPDDEYMEQSTHKKNCSYESYCDNCNRKGHAIDQCEAPCRLNAIGRCHISYACKLKHYYA
jgi:hypothetical protein